jgi:hypothetical protein
MFAPPLQNILSTWHQIQACAKRAGVAVSASPKQGEACELAGVTRAWQARPLSVRVRTRAYGENVPLADGVFPPITSRHYVRADEAVCSVPTVEKYNRYSELGSHCDSLFTHIPPTPYVFSICFRAYGENIVCISGTCTKGAGIPCWWYRTCSTYARALVVVLVMLGFRSVFIVVTKLVASCTSSERSTGVYFWR